MSPRRCTRALTRALLAPLLVAAAAALPVGTAAAVTTPSCASAGITVTSLGGTNFYIDGSNAVQFRSGYTGYRLTNASGTALGDVWAQLSDFTGGALGLAATQPAAQRVGDLTAGGTAARFWYLTASGQSSVTQSHVVTIYTHNPALPNAAVLCSTSDSFASVQGTISANANTVDSVSVSAAKPTLGSRFTVTVLGHTGTIGSGITGDPGAFWMTPSVLDDWPAGSFRLLTTNLNVSPDGTAAAQNYVDTLRIANMSGPDRPYTASYTFEAVGLSSTSAIVQPVQEIASGSQMKHTSSYPASLPAIPSPENDLSLATTSSSSQLDLGGGDVTLTGTAKGTAGAELDSLSLTLPTGASVSPGTARWGDTVLPDPVTSGGKQVFSGPFTVGTGPLKVGISFDATPGNRTVSLAGAIGSTTIGGTTGSSTPASSTVNVDTAPTADDATRSTTPGTPVQVNVGSLMADADGDPLTVTVSPAGHGTFSLEGTTMTYTPADGFEGTDDIGWTVVDGRKGSASAVVHVIVDPEATPPAPLTPQTIDFPQPADIVVGDRQTLKATAAPGSTVAYTSETSDVCTVADDVVTAVSAGECTIDADQSGSDTVAAADQVSRTFTVTAPVVVPTTPTAQEITFPQPSDLTVGDQETLTATASSHRAVAYSSQTLDVCTVADDVVTAVSAGECTIDADQSGGDGYAAADQVSTTFTVATAPVPPAPPVPPTPPAPPAPAAQTITFDAPTSLLGTAPMALLASAGSGLPVGLAVVSGPCTLTGPTLSAGGPGSCTVEATQPGDATHAAAPPVRRTVSFVVPADDHVATEGATAKDVDVLANDPAGVTLRSVSAPGHGSVTIVGGRVRYVPDAAYRGEDSFRYTVAREGRTAAATVTVTVADQRPVLHGGALTQVAGGTARFPVAVSDPNGDPVRLTASSDDPGVTVAVDHGALVLAAAIRTSGDIRITVTASDGAGGIARTTVHDRVTPPAPADVQRRLSSAGTTLSWSPAPTSGASYDVLVEGHVVCHTARTGCALSDVLGPQRSVTVRTVGHDTTRSPRTAAPLTGHGQVLVTTVYFDSGSSTLTADDRRTLDGAIRTVHRYGFGVAHLDGYTDTDGGVAFNLALSHRRTRAVAGYLRDHGALGNVQDWHGETDPVASNDRPSGKARNRRVEVLVRY